MKREIFIDTPYLFQKVKILESKVTQYALSHNMDDFIRTFKWFSECVMQKRC